VTGRRAEETAALACTALSAALSVAAAVFSCGWATAVLASCAAACAAAAFLLALRLRQRLSGALERLWDTVGARGQGEATLPGLEKALHGMADSLARGAEEGRQRLAALDGMSQAVFATDRRLALRMANRSARSLFALEDWRGYSLLNATRSTEIEMAARAALAEGRPLAAEFSPRRGKERRRFLVSVSPMPAEGGAQEAEGVVIVIEDVTRLSRLEQVRKDFVANVSHELRTPIQLIKGFSETLLEETAAGDGDSEERARLRRFAEIIRRNAANMENLTNDLLVIASLENRDGDPSFFRGERQAQPVAAIIVEAIQSVEAQAEKKGVSIEAECPPDLVAAIHGPLVMQALINLLDNAIKYSPAKSRVKTRALEKDGSAVIEVSDKGIGIPAEHIGRVFERFYRVNRARSREAGGTGLGLSIVRHIALLHGGSAEVESHAGEGSTFRIVLPLE